MALAQLRLARSRLDEAQPGRRLRSGVGTSQDEQAGLAGRVAAQAALAGLAGARPDLILVYASVRYDLPQALREINDVTGGVPLVGATTSGQLCGGSLIAPGTGLSVLALAGGGYHFGVDRATGTRVEPFEAGRRLARGARAALGEDGGEHQAMIILADGLAGDQQRLLDGVHRVTGFAVPVVGGCAGDDRHFRETFVFCGNEVLSDAAVGVCVSSDHPLQVVSAHGWRAAGLPLLVTSVDGQVVREIGGRPARTVFEEQFRAINPGDPEVAARQGGWRSEHAFGLIQPDGSLVLRAAFVDDHGELRTLSPLPQYAAVQVVSCQADDLLRVGHDVVSTAAARDEASVVLIFDCVARLDILADRGPEEAARLQEAAGNPVTFGFYTYGEFARTHSVAGYHNATIAAMAL